MSGDRKELIPRRLRLDLLTPAELAIWKAAGEVEEAGCHPRLTNALDLLHKAREAVADFVDGTPTAHLATCELLRARAENEVDAAERAK